MSSPTWALVRRARCLGSSGRRGDSPCGAHGGSGGDSAPGLASRVVREGHGHLLPRPHTLDPEGPTPEQSLRLPSWAGRREEQEVLEHLHPTPGDV